MSSRTARVEALASHALDRYLHLREKLALVEPMLFDKRVVSERGSGPAARGFTTLKHILFLGCIQDVANLCLDDGRKAPSIANIVRALEDGPIRRELRERYSSQGLAFIEQESDPVMLQIQVELERQESAKLELEFDRLHGELKQEWVALRDSPTMQAFDTVRDKITAHTEVLCQSDSYSLIDIASLGIKWGDLGRVSRELEKIVELCGMVVRGTGFGWSELERILGRVSRDFWLGEPAAP